MLDVPARGVSVKTLDASTGALPGTKILVKPRRMAICVNGSFEPEMHVRSLLTDAPDYPINFSNSASRSAVRPARNFA
jgi:hypothetical protein